MNKKFLFNKIRKMKTNKEGNSLRDYLKVLWMNVTALMLNRADFEKYKELVVLRDDIVKISTTSEKVCLKDSLENVKMLMINDIRKSCEKKIFVSVSVKKLHCHFEKIDAIYKNIVDILDADYYSKYALKKKIKKLAKLLLGDILVIKQQIQFGWDETISRLIESMYDLKEISMGLLIFRVDVFTIKSKEYNKIGELESYVLSVIESFKYHVYEIALVYKKAKDYDMLCENENKELTAFNESTITYTPNDKIKDCL